MNNLDSIKVLHIASGDLWAGAEAQVLTLCKQLHIKTYIDVHVILMNTGILEQRLREQGITLTVLDESSLNAVSIFFRLIKLIKQLNPDIIHTHRQKENILGALANLFSSRAKSIRTIHGAPEHQNPMWYKPHKKLIQYLDWLTGVFFQQAIIAVTADLKKSLKKQYPDRKLHCIYNGVETFSDHKKIKKKQHTQIFSVGIAGRLVPVKRIDIFLDMIKIISENSTKTDWNFHIFGDGPLKETLKIQSQSIGIEEWVCFHGHINHMAEQLILLDLLIMCSDHEGMPMIALESINSATPVLAHATGGLIDLLISEQRSFLIEQNSAEHYAKRLMEIRHYGYIDEFRSIYDRFKQNFTAEKNVNHVIKLYQSLING